MKTSFLIITHLSALVLGAWWALRSSTPDLQTGTATKEENAPVPVSSYRILPSRLLDAYRYDSPHFQEVRDSGQQKVPSHPPEERAAQVTDFAAELQSHVDIFNRTGFTDYRFTKAVIERWMLLDPEAAMRFVGTMKIRGGWGDPWPALFNHPPKLDGLQLTKIVRESWISYNRERVLPHLAGFVGTYHLDQLPQILEFLREDGRGEDEKFLEKALEGATAENFSLWIDFLTPLDPSRKELATRMLSQTLIPNSVPPTWINPDANTRGRTYPSREELEALVEKSRGLEIEPFLQGRWQDLLASYEKQKSSPPLDSNSQPDPGNSKPMSEYEVQNSLAGQVNSEIRKVLSGANSTETALQNQFAHIKNEFAELDQNSAYRYVLGQSLIIDPLGTFEFAQGKLPPEGLQKTINDILNDPNANFSIQRRAQLMSELIDSPFRDQIPDPNENLTSLILRYHGFHNDLADAWIRTLPETVVQEVKASNEVAGTIIEHALAK